MRFEKTYGLVFQPIIVASTFPKCWAPESDPQSCALATQLNTDQFVIFLLWLHYLHRLYMVHYPRPKHFPKNTKVSGLIELNLPPSPSDSNYTSTFHPLSRTTPPLYILIAVLTKAMLGCIGKPGQVLCICMTMAE